MSGRIPKQFIEELVARIDIVDVIDARVPLRVGVDDAVGIVRGNLHAPAVSLQRRNPCRERT